ncbi:MAG: Fe-S cluster assembly ATPase SufC [Parcubacteria group bacterium]|nr:Fe-S cluster assembly ATPase SufC [Parcubacteria group bacterium]
MLKISNLQSSIQNKQVLRGVNLEVPDGQIHALMGPNGSGKSTLAHVIMGNPLHQITDGDIIWNGENIRGKAADEIARLGILMSFQSPVEVEGVAFSEFLKMSYNSIMSAKDSSFQPLKSPEFIKILKEKMDFLEMDKNFASRYLNQGFSGGEKKKSEILQLLLLNPKLAIIDEIDSGLDIDSLKVVAKGINKLIQDGSSILLITHYKRILDYIKPNQVHIIMEGRVVQSGGPELVEKLESEGFKWAMEEKNEKRTSSLKILK